VHDSIGELRLISKVTRRGAVSVSLVVSGLIAGDDLSDQIRAAQASGDYPKAAELYRASLKSWEEATDKPPEDYEIVAANYADLLRSLGKARKAQQLEARARKKRRM